MTLLLLLAATAFAYNPLENKVTVVAAPGLEFHAICKAAKTPCAIELDAAAAGDPLRRTPFRADDATVSAAMNRAILRYPGHRWRFRKGVLYVTPNDADEGTPLDKPLTAGKFEETLDTARAEFGAAAGFCSVPAGGDAGPKPRAEKKVSFKLEEATPRAVLTELVFRHGLAGWVVVRSAAGEGKALYCLDLVDYGG
ncbi:MAG: hypothetical protein HY079_15310 [Elusimicrobia bacterium]|nr:hypothetical protein [Elusimicrobiota bacterium]